MKLPTVDMSRFSIQRVRVLLTEDAELPGVLVRVVLDVKHATTGEPCEVVNRELVPYEPMSFQPERLQSTIGRALQRALLHELDECLYINGERVCADPHPETKKTSRLADGR